MSDLSPIPALDETLSAFLDGELDQRETDALLQRLQQEPRLRGTLDRHHRLRASLRGELHPGLDAGFADRVLAGLDDGGSGSSKVVRLAAHRRRHPLTRAVLGLAVAASIAAVTVLTVQVMVPTTGPGFTTLKVADIRGSKPATVDSLRWDELSPDAAAELNSYLISHNNSAIDHGLNGTMGFMRVAAEERGSIDWAGH